MTDPAGLCSADHCITCGDDGVPMRVLSVDPATGLARCADQDRIERDVELALVEAEVGELVLVHADTALARLEEPA